DVMPTTELPITKVLVNHQIQYRRMIGDTENHNNFRDEWGRINLQDWSNIDGSLLVEKDSQKHITILCELTFESKHRQAANSLFPANRAINLDIKVE
ncbi:hypothetical protein, partial [Haemophilus parainfluenzae]|uniref:hypothetical protein n=1 Tax=Haemophilus parainfluenzae TaxID=729 RepID=UPI001CED6E3F